MDVLFQNTRGALNATARRLARDPVIIEFISDEYDEYDEYSGLQDDGTFLSQTAFKLPFMAYFTGELTADQIQRLAAGGQTINNGITLTIPQMIDRYAQRILVRGFWYRVVEQAATEGITNFTLDKIATDSP